MTLISSHSNRLRNDFRELVSSGKHWSRAQIERYETRNEALRDVFVQPRTALFVISETASWRLGRLADALQKADWQVTFLLHEPEAIYMQKLVSLSGTSQGLARNAVVRVADLTGLTQIFNSNYVFISKIMRDMPMTQPSLYARQGSRVCILPYSLFPDYAPQLQYAQRHHFWVTDFAVPSTYHLEDARKVRPFSKSLFVSGWPTLDDARDLLRREVEVETSNTAARILWAPHWTIDSSPRHYGATSMYAKAFEHLLRVGWDVTLRPHPILARKFCAGELSPEIERTFNLFAEANRMSYGPFLNDFFESTVLVTDSYGFLAEYSLFGKKVLFLQREIDSMPNWNTFGSQYFSLSRRVWNIEMLLRELELHQATLGGGCDESKERSTLDLERSMPNFENAVLHRIASGS